MIELFAVFTGSFVLALSGALMPGPLLTVTIAESARFGFRVGPLLMTGHSLLEFLLVTAIVLGLGPFLNLPSVIGIIALLGGFLLLYLGVDMIGSSGRLSLGNQSSETLSQRSRNPIIMGVLASLANPYWTLWWATIGLGYLIAAMKLGLIGVMSFFLGHISADFAWYSLVSLGISRGKIFLSDRSYRSVIRLCGVLLFCFGGWFMLSAKDYLALAFF
jgi:threonine/homoserine/homoserine lactone efflux protein